MLSFLGNFCYVWDLKSQSQVFSVDTKGGNRPVRLIVRESSDDDNEG